MSDHDPLLVDAVQAAAMCGRSVRTWWSWHTSGLVPRPIRVGRSHLWRIADLEAWIDAGCPPRDESAVPTG